MNRPDQRRISYREREGVLWYSPRDIRWSKWGSISLRMFLVGLYPILSLLIGCFLPKLGIKLIEATSIGWTCGALSDAWWFLMKFWAMLEMFPCADG